MQLAEALDDAPAPISATSLDPYGQLIKMLMPRAQSIAIYDRIGPAGLAERRPRFARAASAAAGNALAGTRRGRHAARASPRRSTASTAAHVFMLRDADVGAASAPSASSRRESRKRGEARPFSLVHGLLRPALECLQRELASQYSIGDLQRSLMMRDRDLELLLGAAQGDAGRRVDRRLRAAGAGLRGPPRLQRRRAADSGQEHRGVPHRQGHARRAPVPRCSRSTHRQLLAWTQLHRQTMTANVPGADGPARRRCRTRSCRAR